MATKFFTNDTDKTLLKKFQGVFENNRDIECGDLKSIYKTKKIV